MLWLNTKFSFMVAMGGILLSVINCNNAVDCGVPGSGAMVFFVPDGGSVVGVSMRIHRTMDTMLFAVTFHLFKTTVVTSSGDSSTLDCIA